MSSLTISLGSRSSDRNRLGLAMPTPLSSRQWSFALTRTIRAMAFRPLLFVILLERLSFYGLIAVLEVYLTAPSASGGLGSDEKTATGIIGTFGMASYVLSIVGGRLGDGGISAVRMNRIGMLLMAVGHFLLTIPAMGAAYLGLASIAAGAGAFKPNIYVEFDRSNPEKKGENISLIYVAINLGNFLGFLLVPVIALDSAVKDLLLAHALPSSSSWRFAFGFTAAMISLGLALQTLCSRASGGKRTLEATASQPVSFTFIATSIFAGAVLAIVPQNCVVPVALSAIGVALFWVTRNRSTISIQMQVLTVTSLAILIFFAYQQIPLLVARLAENYVKANWLLRQPLWVSCISPLFALVALAPTNAFFRARRFEVTQRLAIGVVALAASFLMLLFGLLLSQGGFLNPLWLVLHLLFQVLAEICIYNICLETISRVVPQHQLSTAFGLTFFSAGCGNKIAGAIAGWFPNPLSWGATVTLAGHIISLIVVAFILYRITPQVSALLRDIETGEYLTKT